MEPVSLRELKRRADAQPVDAVLWLQLESADEKETRQGKLYLELGFSDGLDRLTVRVWEDSPMLASARELLAPSFLEIKGAWVDRGAYGLEPLQWSYRHLSEAERESLMRGPSQVQETQRLDYAYIEETVSELGDPRLRHLCQAFLAEFGERFRRTAAAREYHHARRGGLVEHVAQMMRSAGALLDVYPRLNRDLVLAGVLFHDCGKLWENCYEKEGFAMPYHEMSELMSHIPLGIELVNRLWREGLETHGDAWSGLSPPSEPVRLHLLHLIASHHGTLEFGSPVPPKTPEAVLLHCIDNIDAKLEMLAETYERSPLLAKNVYDRRRPLYHALIEPLPAFDPAEPAERQEPPAGKRQDAPAATLSQDDAGPPKLPEPDEVSESSVSDSSVS